MEKHIGQIIKQLRKERNMTQEELAIQLNVTAQSVSKWENRTGMPDLTKIVPLATVFGVSTEVLFGRTGTDDEEEVTRIINSARAAITDPSDIELCRKWRKMLLDGLKRFPNNSRLLMECLESGICLAYPKNDTYDRENCKDIYKESIRQAKIIIDFGKNANDVLRAHMIMVLLHSAYGNFEEAEEHAKNFPWRSDMTFYEMYAFISEFKGDYKAKALYCQWDFFYHFEAILDIIVRLADGYFKMNKSEKAERVLKQALGLIETVCQDEEIKPSFHCREQGDIYHWLAKIHMAKGDDGKALEYLSKMVEHDIKERTKYRAGLKIKTPLLCDVDFPFYYVRHNAKKKLNLILNHNTFDRLRDNEVFSELLKQVEESDC